MIRAIVLLALGICLSAPSSAQNAPSEKILELVKRPPSKLMLLMHVSRDDLDPVISITSKGVTSIKHKGLISSSVEENGFLRAWIDKSTGDITAQIYQVAQYRARDWRQYQTATYQTPDGLKQVNAVKLGSDVDCAGYGCTFWEDLGIPIAFSTLEQAADSFDPAHPVNGLKYRLFAQSGDKLDEGIPGNEIVAFVQTVKNAKADLMTLKKAQEK